MSSSNKTNKNKTPTTITTTLRFGLDPTVEAPVRAQRDKRVKLCKRLLKYNESPVSEFCGSLWDETSNVSKMSGIS
jgi:hypothetical protein